ncbi:MAG: isocitrate lyase/phosphoenolpyruvate mutase family protein [Gemmatimonadetes bacterium]|nr:isocitrate lyase/phosphoenolpyruvate mutase family protein [Gemmatimonadota bacterium]
MPDPIAARRAEFRRLHESGCFLIPNPWDVGSAKYLAGLGFKALATTSSGAAWAHGKPDGAMTLDEILAHVRAIVEATDLPVNADFEDGHAPDERGLAENIRRCLETGVAGLSIEDSTGDASRPLYDFDEAVARVRVARETVDAAGGDALLVARAECFLVGHPEPLKEATKRLVAYAEAGADCLYAPGLRTREEIETIVRAVAPKPVNVLAGWPIGFTLEELGAMGVRRVSVGGALARSAWAGFMRAAKELADGRFDGFAGTASGDELNRFFAEANARRRPARSGWPRAR